MTPRQAWQPITPRGVAAFAYSSFTRLFIVQFVIALLVAFSCVWVISVRWFPVVEESIRAMPAETAIKDGVLISGSAAAHRLAGNASFEILLDPRRSGGASGGADVSIVLSESTWFVCGVLGCSSFSYPKQTTILLNRDQAEPWWGAWRKALVGGVIAGVTITLLAMWALLGAVFAPIVRMMGFFADRVLSTGGSWRICAAALLPGSFILIVGLILYSVEAIDLLRLGLFYAVHLACCLFFLFTSPVFLERIGPRRRNPFTSGERQGEKSSAKKPRRNPFGRNT